jgi:alkaline phosphatase D
LYRSFSFGDLAELIITDERLYRDGPPCGMDIWQRYVLAKSCPEREQLSRTMLGVTQKEWFIEKVKTSRSAWKIWANELMLMPLKLLNAGPQSIYLSFDTWDGYPAERADILRRLQGVQNLIAISGDNHSFASGYLHADYDTSSSPATGIEFVGGSVTSSNLEEIFNALFPSPSNPIPRSLPRVPPAAIASAARSGNRGMQFFSSTTHGYAVLDITPWALQCSMWQVSTIREPDGDIESAAQLCSVAKSYVLVCAVVSFSNGSGLIAPPAM